MSKFSYFAKGVTNTVPEREVTLQEVFSIIKDNEELKRDTDTLRSTADEQKRKEFKKTSLPSVTFSGTFSRRQDDELTMHSNLLCLDFDHVGDEEKIRNVRIKLLNDPYIDTALLFTSPSSDGIKWVVWIDINSHTHLDHFLAIENYLCSIYELEIDKQCKNVSRSCFLCHDPQVVIINEPSKKGLDVDFWLPKKPVKDNSPKIDLVEHGDFALIVNAIIEQGIDITNDYGDWFHIGCAIASCMGEEGRGAFHSISQLSEKYFESTTDRQYDACLRCRGDISIGTLIYIAQNNGVKIPNITTKASITSNTSGEAYSITSNALGEACEAFEGAEAMLDEENERGGDVNLPMICDKINHDTLPDILKKILKQATSKREYDMIFMGSLVVLAGTINRISGKYGKKYSYPYLNYFLVAPAASGKGVLTACQELAMPIHERYAQIYKEQMKEYNANKGKENENLERPRRRLLFIPANNSSSGFVQLLHENNDTGIVFETEADALADAWNGPDYSNYNTLFRRAFGHENCASYRKTDQELVEMHPRLASVLSGTEGQVKRLIHSSENGLHSRFLYYYLNRDKGWQDPFDDDELSIDEIFRQIGEEYLPFYDALQNKPTESKFHFTNEQRRKFNTYFAFSKDYYTDVYVGGMDSSIHRMGTCCFRIAMALSSIREVCSGNIRDNIYCSDEDLDNAMAICDVLIKHTDYVSGYLDDASLECKNDRSFTAQKLCELLPQGAFAYKETIAIAIKYGVSKSTGERLFRQLRRDGLVEKLAHGKYQKKK